MWSYWSKRPALSPWASMTQGRGAPDVTDEDYSYITSQDLEDRGPPEDDVLLVRYKGRTEEARFPAYSIGDGKLMVHDIRERVGIMLDLSDAQARRVRLFYKGRQMKEPGALARDYGVKNMSEVLAMVREDPDEARGAHEEEPEDVSSHGGSSVSTDKSKRRKGRKKKKPQSPVPSADGPLDPAAAAHRDAQLDKLDEVAAYYETELESRCQAFMREPPREWTAREDEHRKLSETVLHHVILKLDGVEPNGDEVIRSSRKRLVKDMQAVLAGLDAAKNGG